MKKTFKNNIKRRKQGVSFNPSHEYLDDAVNKFLKKGGKITKIEDVSNDYETFMANHKSSAYSADLYLLNS